MHNLFEMLQ